MANFDCKLTHTYTHKRALTHRRTHTHTHTHTQTHAHTHTHTDAHTHTHMLICVNLNALVRSSLNFGFVFKTVY